MDYIVEGWKWDDIDMRERQNIKMKDCERDLTINLLGGDTKEYNVHFEGLQNSLY